MQTKKENINKIILSTARDEFLKNGYSKTSMRTIAKKANVTLSNIYNYFKNKDEILEVILQPLLNKIESDLGNEKDPHIRAKNWFYSEDLTQTEDFKAQLKFMLDYKEEIDLLFNKCAGSKYENIKEQFINNYTESAKHFLEVLKDNFPQVNKDISEFFIHMLAAWWIQVMSEVVSHNLSENEIRDFGTEFITFGTGGWKMLLNM